MQVEDACSGNSGRISGRTGDSGLRIISLTVSALATALIFAITIVSALR